MPRPSLASHLSLGRLKHGPFHHSKSDLTSGQTTPQPGTSGILTPGLTGNGMPSPTRSHYPFDKSSGLVLHVQVLRGRDLAAKDKSGTSDPYLVIILGDARQATSIIPKTLNPEWKQSFELPVVGIQSLLLDIICWDKDRFGKDYMGEVDVALEDIFVKNGPASLQPQWFKLQSKRSGKKNNAISGEVQLQFSLSDSSNPSATGQQITQKFWDIIAQEPAQEDEDSDELARIETFDQEADFDEHGMVVPSQDSQEGETLETEKRRKKLAKLRRKTKLRSYQFSGSSDVAGVLFLEISNITDLPPEKNVTRTSFDMDPFVVTSLGKKTYRTRVVRHNLNPVFEEKLVFQVLRHEINYSVNFTVIDRDKLSGNDFVGSVALPLEQIKANTPEADNTTGLFKVSDPDPSMSTSVERRSRFRLPLSRTTSHHSLSRSRNASSQNLPRLSRTTSSSSNVGFSRPQLKSEDSTFSLERSRSRDELSQSGPTSMPGSNIPRQGSNNGANDTSMPAFEGEANEAAGFTTFALPLKLKHQERWEDKHAPILQVRAKYLPYQALRQQFWRAMLKQYDADENGNIDKVELTTMLDTLGSTLRNATIDSFFSRFAKENGGEEVLTMDQAVMCLEDQLQEGRKPSLRESLKASMSGLTSTMNGQSSEPASIGSSAYGTPLNNRSESSLIPALEVMDLSKEGEEGMHLPINDLVDEEQVEEHVVEIQECPICHQPRLNKKGTEVDIITHIATCASHDWRAVNNIVMGGFVTSSQAQRKWYSKVITKIGYGGYKLGANSANILVQDRITGQINEERMSVYVRLGIRLLYKGLKSREMEKKRIRKLLRSMSFKQGRKYDDPASAASIPGFIAFHQLDMSEVLLNQADFKSFNQFFYRKLKPDARPCSAPDRPEIVTSPADCRTVMFNRLEDAQRIWVKGREFSIERLLGDAYPQDVKRYIGGALGIFRLAPQDYHRFHIPVDGIMGEPKLIEGEYYTVNPMAIRSALDVYGENIRVCVPIESKAHGRVMVICVGAMMVGSTVITRKEGEEVKRAEELGYFKFGGSTILLLFEPGTMAFDDDLVDNSNGALETLIRVGMSIGHRPDHEPHLPDMRKKNPTMAEKQDAKRRIEGSLAPHAVAGPDDVMRELGQGME